MRTCLLLLGLAIGSYALEPEDLHGMWRGAFVAESTSLVEIFYRADATAEWRLKFTPPGHPQIKVQISGTWSVKGDTTFARFTGGWFQYGDEVPATLEKSPIRWVQNQITSIVPGNPRKKNVKFCFDDGCQVQLLSYLGASLAFTLPTVGGGVYIRSSRAQLEPAQCRTGSVAWRVLRDGWAFDLMGRPDL
ncbi:MAG: hypothetical protein ABIW76_16785 [Fibrobacteria bacterium]